MTRKTIGVVLLLAMVPVMGCTTYKSATINGNPPAIGEENEQVRKVAVGDQVKITLSPTESLTGEVASISEDEIVIKKSGNYGQEETSIGLSTIEAVEVERPAGPLKMAGGTVIITLAIVASLALLIGSNGGFAGN